MKANRNIQMSLLSETNIAEAKYQMNQLDMNSIYQKINNHYIPIIFFDNQGIYAENITIKSKRLSKDVIFIYTLRSNNMLLKTKDIISGKENYQKEEFIGDTL